jgi:hypothetical protein
MAFMSMLVVCAPVIVPIVIENLLKYFSP